MMSQKAYAKINLVENLHFHGERQDGVSLEMDARPDDPNAAGLTPMELLLQAMGGCTAVDVVGMLRKMRIEPEKFEIVIEGVKRDKPPKMYQQIDVVYRCKAKNLTLKNLERAVGLSIEKYCSVSNALKETAEINWRCEIIK